MEESDAVLPAGDGDEEPLHAAEELILLHSPGHSTLEVFHIVLGA